MAPRKEIAPPEEIVPPKEWTLMFYFASDHPLAPEFVTQLKAIKQAGFHTDANVIVQFDPHPEFAETHIFDINHTKKFDANGAKKSRIGYIGSNPEDPFVTSLMTDKLWKEDGEAGSIRQQIIDRVMDEVAKETLMGKARFNGKGEAPNGKLFDPPFPPPSMSENKAAATLSQKELGLAEGKASNELIPEDKSSTELPPMKSLESFLTFCRTEYPASHYILFILGHGVVVGNDSFLFDANAPEHTLSLRGLRKLLQDFHDNIQSEETKKTKGIKGELELISFHSCSMSSLEVACELQGLANYMLASQSPSFVGSWPYRQILIQIFKYLDRKDNKDNDVKNLFAKIFHYCWYNSHDFLVAGYSSDLCLCDLDKVQAIKVPILKLSASLIAGLKLKDTRAQKFVRECILLAHLDAQSYFFEKYTDLFDFCFQLQQRLKPANRPRFPSKSRPIEALKAITDACQMVLTVLAKGVKDNDADRLIVRSDFVGSACQYSHGLSVYFPWSQPIDSEFWPTEYNQYRFIDENGTEEKNKKPTWSDFLKAYFEETRRHTRMREFDEAKPPGFENEIRELDLSGSLLEAFTGGMLNSNGQLDGHDEPVKTDPASTIGAGGGCQSIKNYPPRTREPKAKVYKPRKIQKDSTLPLDKEGSNFDPDGIFN